jgi:steroid delta-isomerase-like uncharacterized protein
MASHDNAAIARALNEAYNARDWDTAVSLTSPDVTMVNVATGQMFHGPDGVREFLAGWATAFPDSQVELTRVVADEAAAAMEFRGRGTHSGPLAGPTGEIPPTGRSVDVPFAQILEVQVGKITQGRLYFDLTGMLRQLGISGEAPT